MILLQSNFESPLGEAIGIPLIIGLVVIIVALAIKMTKSKRPH